MSRNFQELTIKDSFMFAAVMSDEKQCRELLELVLEMKILQVTVIAEKSMSYRPDYHGVRMDVLAEENGVPLNQGQKTVFLSTKGRNEDDVPKELVDFLKYVGDPNNFPADMEADSFVAQVERRVQAIKANRDWEARFMLLELMLKDERKEGREEGLLEGLLEGRREGIFELLAMYGEIPEDIRSRINDEADEMVLKRWLTTAAKASSIEEFREKMQ